jgi:demethylmenaquinone methyltransferase/2-methoxy-6-polyprenyl-1,4-benzoquinol methylase
VTLSGLHAKRGECLRGKLKNLFSWEVIEVSKSLNTKEKYNRIAGIFDLINRGSEKKWFSKWKTQFFSPLKGDLLEVGIGTGKSINFYTENAKVIGIDFSEEMLKKAKERLIKSGTKNITLKQMDVENLDFKDNSFDYVVTCCVFCSVPDPVKGLKEIKRVLKPDGKLIMIEHVLSENPIIALLERLHNPIIEFFMGANINRDTKQNILYSGMEIIEDRNLALFDVFRLFEVKKGG